MLGLWRRSRARSPSRLGRTRTERLENFKSVKNRMYFRVQVSSLFRSDGRNGPARPSAAGRSRPSRFSPGPVSYRAAATRTRLIVSDLYTDHRHDPTSILVLGWATYRYAAAHPAFLSQRFLHAGVARVSTARVPRTSHSTVPHWTPGPPPGVSVQVSTRVLISHHLQPFCSWCMTVDSFLKRFECGCGNIRRLKCFLK